MSDSPTNTAPTEAPAASAAPNAPAPTEPGDMYTRAEVEQILAAERQTAQPAQPAMSAIERFRQRAAGSAAKPTAAQPSGGNSDIAELAQLMRLSLAHQISQSMPKAAPPAPPMTPHDKINSTDPEVWVGRGKANSFTSEDRAALVDHHRSELAKAGFRGDIESEATARANKQIVSAAQRALRSIKIGPGSGSAIISGDILTGRR